MCEEMADSILRTICDYHGKCTDLLHAVKLRHGTDGFTSSPKEGMLWIFVSPEKIRRLQPGLNPRTRVPEASMLTTRPLKPLYQSVVKEHKQPYLERATKPRTRQTNLVWWQQSSATLTLRSVQYGSHGPYH
jgi:hypothetical protein